MAQRKNRESVIIEKPAGELVMQLASMANFPQEKAAVEAMARALERAATDTGIRMQAIIDECLDGGSWCPTPFDLRTLAAGMKERIREKREGSKRAEWEREYGPCDPDWSSKLITSVMNRDGHTDQARAVRDEAIRNMLYYTEGDGMEFGDREFWEGPRKDGLLSARAKLLRDHPAEVERIREAGGWRTERELQGVPA